MRKLLFRLLSVSGIRFGGAALNFALAIIAGRWLGVESSGVFFWYLGAVSVFSVFARLGLDKGYIKLGAIFGSSEGPSAATNYLVKAYGLKMMALCVAAGLGLLIYVRFFSSVVGIANGGLVVAIVFSVSILFVSFVTSLGSVAIGSGAVGVGTSAISFIPAFVAVLLVFFQVVSVDAVGFAFSYLIGWICAFLFVLMYLRPWRVVAISANEERLDVSVSAWRGSIVPFGIIGVANVVEQWLPTILAGGFFSTEEAAYFGVSTRIVGAIQILMVSASSAFSKQYADCEPSNLPLLVKSAVRSVALVGGGVLVAVYFFAAPLLSIFGAGFSAAEGVMKVLLVGQLFNIFFGSYAVVLMMRGHVLGVAKIFLITTFFYFAFALFAAFSGSALFLAFSAVCSVACQSLGCFYLYKKTAL